MDRLNQLRGAAGDSTLDTTSPPSESFMTANESTSKYFSLSEVDSSFDISPIKDVSLASATADSESTITEDGLIPNLSPIRKKNDILDSYKIGKQIEAANILSGGVDIFDDNDNSYDGDELVIDDNIELDEKSNSEIKQETVDFKSEMIESTLIEGEADVASKDTEVVLQIDGKNVDAIDIGNGLYLYRKDGEEELAAVQIIDDEKQQPSFKFLKVRENTEGNLEVYEEIEVEIQKEVPAREGTDINTPHVPIRDINKVINDTTSNKVDKNKTLQIEQTSSICDVDNEYNKDVLESKSEVNLNGKMVKFNESRKSPVIGSFAYHSTPNKEGKPLTKTMVDLQLHPSRHSDNIKKTIEVHTDNCKQKMIENQIKHKDFIEEKEPYTLPAENDATTMLIDEKSEENINNGNEVIKSDNLSLQNNVINTLNTIDVTISKANEPAEITKQHDQQNVPVEVKNKTLEPEKLVTFDKGVVLDTGNSNMPQCYDQVENTMKNHKHIEQDDSEVNISKIDISHEIILSNQSSEEANKKSETHIKCNSTDSSQGILCSLDEQSQNNKGQDNQIAQIKDHIVGDKVVSNENNSLDIAEKSSAPKHFETMNIHKDLKENNILKNITEDRIECSKAFREDSEFKNEIAKEMDKDINREENNKNTLDQYIEESNVCNNQNIESIPLSNKSTLSVQFDIHNENSDTKKSLPFNSTEKSVQSQEKSPCEQKHLVNKSDESKTVEKSSNDCKNIIQSKGDILIEDKEVNIKKGQDKLLDDKVIEMENFKTEHISEIKPLKNREESEVPIQIETKLESESNETQKDIKIIDDESKSISTGSAVPFGKWTEANRQEFLNKIKGTRILVNNSNNKAIKNSNDLNRRDVLKKIASKRHTSTISKTQDLCTTNSTKPETVFTSKPVIPIEELNAVPKIPNAIASHESKIPLKVGTSTSKTNEVTIKKSTKPDSIRKPLAIPTKVTSTVTSITKKESVQRKAVKDLIDKTIEGMIIKAFPSKPTSTETKASDSNVVNTSTTSTTLDAIEMKMNELHGIPFIERPPHELPKVNNPVPQNYVPADQEKISDIKPTKVPKLLSSNNKDTQEPVNVNTLEVDSEEEVIEHEPVTGDIEIKHDLPSNLSLNESSIKTETHNLNKDDTKKEPVITEKDFDKFARRNSVSYENCLTVSFDKQEPLNVVKAVIEMDIAPKNHNKNEVLKIESKPHHASKIQNINLNKHPNKIYSSTKIGRAIEDPSNKHYHSKLQIAYQSALTAKRQLSCPIDIIEDQPVKVVFMDAKTDFVPNILNIQGQELSSSEKKNAEEDTIHATDSLNSDLVNAVDEEKPQEDIKVKTKHQRKQVLTPVETPELELIEPRDLGIDVSPKKKRKTEDNKADKNSKNVIHKKSYLLGRSVVEDKILKIQNLTNNESKSTLNRHEEIVPKDAVTAIDSLVKAAEMLENQSENMNSSTTSNSDSLPSTTPVKRGRGRPRKYPLPDVTTDKPKVPSPQKKPRLIDAKQNKRDTEDEESSDEAAVKENWTMGKINENIVCPICNKLFRSENVIFKHVKHCSGPSPNRSDTSTRSARKGRSSQESDDKSHGSQDEMDVDDEKTYEDNEDMITERKSHDTINKSDEDNNVIVIEDRPVKERSKKHTDEKQCESRLGMKNRIQNTSSSNLECEFCGKTFRQLSYLVNHKLQHKKENIKKIEKSEMGNKSVLSCDICYKGFRKLHHLAQHRIIHNQSSTPNKLLRKNSSEQIIYTTEKEETSKQSEDPSAGFRCEPCDKSFRKLHHLVEHRETHDGINRQKTSCPEQNTIDKTIPPPQCDICKKTFRKLHHLIEHKEQHVETSSEKSDDKSVKSSLSTKDIIHECSLCYMVFPNEHSLNKHTIICQRKKRLSKQPKQVNEGEPDNIETENFKVEEDKIDDGDEPEIILDEVKVINLEKDDDDIDMFTADVVIQEEHTELPNITDIHPPNVVEDKKIENQKEHDNVTEVIVPKIEHFVEIKDKKDKTEANEIERVQDNLKKKTNIHKDKMVPTVTKRPKKISVGLKTVDENKPLEAISDDDEVRYMLNPDYKPEDTSDDKLFLKVKAKKRNSLQIERPNSKDLIKRRTSLQHPPKIPRLKSKPIENKIVTTNTALIKNIPKNTKVKPNPSTDSDDSDVKYSFPVKLPKPTHEKTLKDTEKRTLRKSLEEKRKSLSGIAKRKSLGKSIAAAPPKVQQQSSVKQVKRRTRDVEHRCDCGQLFSSAALLSRHTSLAHTPPRIRKRRSPPPDTDNKTLIKRAPRKSSDTTKQTVVARKPSVRSDASSSLPKPNRSAKATTETKLSEVRKSIKPTEKEIELSKTANTSKLRRSGAHRGVPVPEKMRNLYQRGGKK